MLTKKIEYNHCCFKYFIFFLSLLTTFVVSIQTTPVQADAQSLPDHSNHHVSLPFFSAITHGLSYAMLTLAMTNFVAHSRPSYSNNTLMSCPPNEKGLIPLGQENFTACLQHNPSGKYVLVSPIHFSNFSDEEKIHYPMYNSSLPFRGTLDTGDYYIADLYLNRTVMSSLFGVIANSNFRVHFKNPYVISTRYTAVLAAIARGHNTINMTVDHATAITICPPHISCHSNYSRYAAIVIGVAHNSQLSISFSAQSTYSQTDTPHAHAGIVAAQLIHSSIDMNVTTHFSQLTTSGHSAYAGAVGYHVFGSCRSCSFKAQTNFNNISIVSKGIANTVGATVGGLIGYSSSTKEDRPVNKINSTINTITIHSSGQNSRVGACVGRADSIINTIHFSVNDAEIIGNSALVGGVVGELTGGAPLVHKLAPPHTITANVGKVLIRNTGKNSFTGMMIGFVSMHNEGLNLWLQGGQINISTHATPAALAIGHLHSIIQDSYVVIGNVVATVNGQPSAIGVGSISTLPSNKNLAVLFVAGQAKISDPAFILQPGTCPYSLVDQSGVNVNIDNLGCKNARVMHSVEPQDWRSVMEQLQPILCPSQPQNLSCHYLNEQPVALAAIPSSSGRFYLVSQQRYPYNRPAERDALVRVTGLQLLAHQLNPSVDPLFGSNGTALYSPNNDTLLLPPPHSVNVDGDHLYHLYKDSDQPVLAHFKLNHANDVYHRNPLVTEGDIIQLDQGGIWLQRHHLLEHYIIDPTTLSLTKKDQVIQLTTDSIDISTPVIGAQFFCQGIYVARLIDSKPTHPDAQAAILYEKYPINNHASTMWNETVYGHFFNASQYTMQVIMNNHGEAFIALLPSTDLLIKNNDSEVVAYTADLMPQGGPAKWSYSTPSIFAVHSSEFGSESRPSPEFCLGPGLKSKKLNVTFVFAASASAVLTCTGLITIGTCILYRKKNCNCHHQYKSLHISKEKNSRNNSAINELFPSFSWDERDPLLCDTQHL